MTMDEGPSEERHADPALVQIDPAFRSGSLTAIGIMVGFSLGFLTRWAAVPGSWSRADFSALAAITIGIALQILSLAMLLSIESLILANYNRMIRIFLTGLVLVAVGVLLAVFVDIGGEGQKLLG